MAGLLGWDFDLDPETGEYELLSPDRDARSPV
jgi:hypothetical protein